MDAVTYRTENLRTFLDMDIEWKWVEHDLAKMLKAVSRYVDVEGNVLTGKRLRDEIENFLVSNWQVQRVQLREV